MRDYSENNMLVVLLRGALLVGICVLCYACGRTPHIPEGALIVDIRIQTPLAEFLDGDGDHLALETSEESLLEVVSKIRIENDTIYVLDRPRRTIRLFDRRSGAWLGKIAKIGRGSGEYIDLQDFDVSGSRIYALAGADKKINVYTPTGVLEREIRLEERYAKLAVLSPEAIWLYAEKSNEGRFDYTLYNPLKGEVVARFAPFSKNESYSHPDVSPFCGREADTLFTAKYFDDIVYRLAASDYEPAYRFDLNTDYKITQEELQQKTSSELSDAYKWKEVLRQIRFLKRSGMGTYAVANCFFEGEALRDCLLKTSDLDKRVLFHRLGDIDPDYPFLLSNGIVGFDGDFLITVVQALVLSNLSRQCGISDFEDVQEGQNPVLFFYRLKL